MNPRERKLTIIVGTIFVAGGLFYGVQLMFVAPLHEAQTQYENLLGKQNDLKKLIRTEKDLAEKWMADARRTFSFEAAEAQDLFGEDLKKIAKRHGFTAANFKPRTGKLIGAKTKITTVAYGISATGPYPKAVDFLRDIYRAPYLCQVTSLTLTPLGPKQGRDLVKVEFTAETPVLPRISRNQIKPVANATTMPADPEPPLAPFREGLPPESRYLVLAERNIFRSFMPAPTNLVMIDNQDFKTVALEVKFFWEGKVKKQLFETVPGKTQKPVSSQGEVVEISGSYADGEPIASKRLDFNERKDWVFQVPSHSPAPPAETVILAVTNQDGKEVLLNVVITLKDNKQFRPPTMLIEPGRTVDVGEWEARQVQASATYKSTKPGPGATYQPSTAKQTLIIPIESAVAVAQGPAGPTSPEDPAADAQFRVTGLWAYPDAQEMIVSGPTERKVISTGEEGLVDTGTLLAVHPLGGVVKMPSGNFYIYPLGKSFTERVLLHVKDESELAQAIDAWTQE